MALLPELEPASDETEAGVRDLFRSLGLSVIDEIWERAYSGEAPAGFAAQPWVALSRGKVTGFCATRQRRFHIGGDDVEGQLLFHFGVARGEEGDAAAKVLLTELPQRTKISFAGAWSVAGNRFLRTHLWQPTAVFPRFRVDPPDTKPVVFTTPRETGEEAVDWDDFQGTWRESGRFFPYRAAAWEPWLREPRAGTEFQTYSFQKDERPAAYFRTRTMDSATPEAREIHVVDFAIKPSAVVEAAGFLNNLAWEKQQPVYLSLLEPQFVKVLREFGATELPPRWELFWYLGDQRERILGTVLDRARDWVLTPTDVEQDLG